MKIDWQHDGMTGNFTARANLRTIIISQDAALFTWSIRVNGTPYFLNLPTADEAKRCAELLPDYDWNVAATREAYIAENGR